METDKIASASEAAGAAARILGPHAGASNVMSDLLGRLRLIETLLRCATAPELRGNRVVNAARSACERLTHVREVVEGRLAKHLRTGDASTFICNAADRQAFAECSEAAHECSRELVASLVSGAGTGVATLRAAIARAADAPLAGGCGGAATCGAPSGPLVSDRVFRQALAGAIAPRQDEGGVGDEGSAAGAAAAAAASATAGSRDALAGVPRVAWSDIEWPDGAAPTETDPNRHLIARGGFGTVYRASLRGLGPVALKVLDMEGRIAPKRLQQVGSECRNQLRASAHPNVVSFVGLVKDDATGRVGLVSHLAEGGSLYDGMMEDPTDAWAKLSPRVKLRSLLGAVAAVAHMHAIGVIHGDVKPRNVLLAAPVEDGVEPLCFVCDFGLAKTIGTVRSSMRRSTLTSGLAAAGGTVGYMAPETSLRSEVVPASDVFCLALVIWAGLTGEDAFEGIADAATYAVRVGDRALRPDLAMLPAGCPNALSDLLRRCWAADPSARPSAECMLDELTQMTAVDGSRLASTSGGATLKPEPANRQGQVKAASGGWRRALALRGSQLGGKTMPKQPVTDEQVSRLIALTTQPDSHKTAMQSVVELLRSTNGTHAERAAGALQDVASRSKALRQAVADAGGIAPLVGLLSSGWGGAAEQAARALASMSAGSEALRQAVADAGGIAPLVGLLSSGWGGAAEQAARALASMSAGSEALRQAVADAGGIRPWWKRGWRWPRA